MDARENTATLLRLVNGYYVSQAIHVAASLGIADLLADGARTSDDLAEAAGADADSLYRLLRALASVGVLHEGDGRLFSLTPVGELLRSDVPGSLHGWAAYAGRPYFWAAWAELLHSVRTGENAFRHVHGQDIWSYRADRPEESVLFDAAMKALTGASNAALIDAFDFSRFGTLVDVGGGNGALLAERARLESGATGSPLRPGARRRGRGSGARSGRCRGSLPDRERQLLRGSARRRRRVPAQEHHPRLGGRGLERDPAGGSRRDVGGCDPARRRARPWRTQRGCSDEVLRPEHARRSRWARTNAGRVRLPLRVNGLPPGRRDTDGRHAHRLRRRARSRSSRRSSRRRRRRRRPAAGRADRRRTSPRGRGP